MPQKTARRAWPTTVLVVAVTGAAMAGLALALWSSALYRTTWADDTWGRPILATHLASVAAAIAGGVFLISRRPRNPCGYVAVAIGVAFGAWFVAIFHIDVGAGWKLGIPVVLVWSLRPLLFWLVLAYPIGRLDRPSRRLYSVYIVCSALVFAIQFVTVADDPSWPLDVFHESTWTMLTASVWWDVSALLWLALILVVVQRRRLRFRGESAQRMLNAAWYAALVATGGDFILIATGPMRDISSHDGGLTPFGMCIQFLDYARWGLVVATLAVAARRSWPREEPRAASIDIDPTLLDGSLRDSLVHALGNPNADIVLADRDGHWVDGHGDSRVAPDTGSTLLLRDGVPVAALEHDETIAAHPALLDAAATAVALQLEARHQNERAQAREAELRVLARDVLEADDRARRDLERDLHDGAQQILVGLTLQAALAARAKGGSADPAAIAELADAVDDAREELLRIASGRPPALLAERGLEGAIGALVLTAGLPIRVVADPCADLPAPLQRAIWFTASEAVTNALKHAGAESLELSLRRVDGTVTLVVRDDGRGGVDRPPAALAARVDEAGGRLAVESNGHGTLVRAEFETATS